MEKLQSLADFLGVPDPQQGSAPRPSDLALSAEPLDALTGKQFAEAVLQSEEFRRYIVNGLVLGEIPPAVLCRLIDHGWGKPVERVEVHAVHDLEGLSPSELRVHLQERIESLVVMMRMLDSDETEASVH